MKIDVVEGILEFGWFLVCLDIEFECFGSLIFFIFVYE